MDILMQHSLLDMENLFTLYSLLFILFVYLFYMFMVNYSPSLIKLNLYVFCLMFVVTLNLIMISISLSLPHDYSSSKVYQPRLCVNT